MAIFTTNSGEERTGALTIVCILILISLDIGLSIAFDIEFLALLFILIPYLLLVGYYTRKEWLEDIVQKEPYDHLLE